MKKKILIIVGSVVVVISVVLVIVVANLNKIVNSRKDALLAQAEKQIGREISIGNVGVVLWPELGVRVEDVSLADDPAYSQEPFVSAGDIRVNVKLLPLLKRRVEVKRFVANKPVINIIRADSTHFNFTSLVTAASGGKAAATGKDGGAAAAPIVLAFADIKDGTVRYVDRMTGLDRTIKDIDFAASNLSPGSRATATLAAAVFGDDQDVSLEAAVGPVERMAGPADFAPAPLEATLTLEPVKLSQLAAFNPKPAKPFDPAQDGTVQATAKLSGTVGAAMLDELHAQLALLGASEPNVDITAHGGPFNLVAESTLVFSDATLEGKATAGPIALSALKLKPADPSKPAPELGGDVSGSATFKGRVTELAFDATVDATAASMETKPTFKKPAGVPATVKAVGTFRPEKTPGEGIEFSKLDIVFHALRATGNGRMVPFKGREALDIALDAETPLAPWAELMPQMAAFAPTGNASAKVKISGAPKPGVPPVITGTATFANVGATLPQVPEKLRDGTGSATFTAKTAKLSQATFKIGKSAFRVEGEATSFKPMAATYTATSDEVWRADVQAAAPNAPKLPRPEVFKDLVARGTLRESAPKVMENDLVLTSASGVFSNVDYTHFSADLKTTPEKVFINSFSAKAMGGNVSGKGTFEPKVARFDVDTKITQVNLVEYFRFKAPALADVFVGRLDADLAIAGEGKTWEVLQKTLAGEGGAVVFEGAFLNVNFMQQIMGAIQGIPMVPATFTAQMKAKNPKMFAENKTAFENLTGKVQIADGKIQAPDLKLVTPDFRMDGAGWFSFGKEMDLKSTLTLSEKLTKDIVAQVPMAKYILSSSGRIEVPLSLTGGLMKPNVTVNTAALTARAQQSFMQDSKQKLDQKVQGGVKDLLGGFGKKKEAPKPPPADTTRAPR